MITKKDWKNFRSTGLLLIINQILHIFGWALVFEVEDESGEVVDVYPARVKFRGFDNDNIVESYKKLSKFMLDNADELYKEAQE